MTSQYEFSRAEWSDIASLPVLVGFAMAEAAESGFVGSLVEIRTLSQQLRDRDEDGPGVALIHAASSLDIRDKIEEYDGHDKELLGDVAVQSCVQVGKMLDAKVQPDESADYKRWVYQVASEVANAAKESGVRVSPAEAALLIRLDEALAST